jgi:hypothetical protein
MKPLRRFFCGPMPIQSTFGCQFGILSLEFLFVVFNCKYKN